MKITKQDYKNLLQCRKKAWINFTKNNSSTFFKYIQLKKVICLDKELIRWLEKCKLKTKILQKNAAFFDLDTDNGLYFEEKVYKIFANKYTNDEILNLKPTHDINKAIHQTKGALKNEKYKLIFEAAFENNYARTRIDILERDACNPSQWNLYEVKSKTNQPKNVRSYLPDIEYQYAVTYNQIYLQNISLILFTEVVTIDYYKAGFFDVVHSFQKPRIKEKILLKQYLDQAKDQIYDQIEQTYNFKKVATDDQFNGLQLLLEPQCTDHRKKNPYCPHIIPYIAFSNTVFQLYKLKSTKKVLILNEAPHQSLHFSDLIMTQVANKNIINWKKNAKWNRQIAFYQQRQRHQCNYMMHRNEVEQELKKYQTPIYMFDFETVFHPIVTDQFFKAIPYEQIPFQYSIHIIQNKEKFNYQTLAHITHKESLIDFSTKNCRQLFLLQFISDMTDDVWKTHVKPVYVAYSKSFEKKVVENMILYAKHCCSERQDTKEQQKWKTIIGKLYFIIDNLIDLMDFFKNFSIYNDNFCGRTSLKKVLPSMVPGFSYENLQIQNGVMAMAIASKYLLKKISQKEWINNMKPHLLKYCGQDTLAMVAILQKIILIVHQKYNTEKVYEYPLSCR